MNYPDGPTSEAQIDSTDYDSVLLGENELGSVYVHGPFGNVESDVKIAYLIVNVNSQDTQISCYEQGIFTFRIKYIIPILVDGTYKLFFVNAP